MGGTSTRFLVLPLAWGADEFYLRIAYCCKCELASLAIHTHQNLCLPAARGAWYSFSALCASAPPRQPVRSCSCLLAPHSLLQKRHRSPSSPTTCSPVSSITKESPSPLLPVASTSSVCAVPLLPTRLQPFCLEIFVPRTLISYGHPMHLLSLRESWIRGHELCRSGVRGQRSG